MSKNEKLRVTRIDHEFNDMDIYEIKKKATEYKRSKKIHHRKSNKYDNKLRKMRSKIEEVKNLINKSDEIELEIRKCKGHLYGCKFLDLTNIVCLHEENCISAVQHDVLKYKNILAKVENILDF